MKLSILHGDIFQRIRDIPDGSVDLCITSPPYWGLRDYGIEGQLGNEPTMEAYLDNTMRWVKEVYRVLKPTGSFVINLGDCFIGGGRISQTGNGLDANIKTIGLQPQKDHILSREKIGKTLTAPIYKEKQLLSVSSFAYCRIISETDFVCRGEHIWAKPNVPSPIRCRLKHSHEKLFWFVKDADKYYFDQKPWMKGIKDTSVASHGRNQNTTPQFADNIGLSESSCFRRKPTREKDSPHSDNINLSGSSCFRSGHGNDYKYKDNPKTDSDAFPRGSFHAYVAETIEHSWRVVPVGEKQNGFELEGKKPQSEHIAPFPTTLIEPYIKSLCPQDGIILDPFLGSGTTMRVAMEQGRNSIGIELNEKYIDYAKKRLNWKAGLGVEYEG